MRRRPLCSVSSVLMIVVLMALASARTNASTAQSKFSRADLNSLLHCLWTSERTSILDPKFVINGTMKMAYVISDHQDQGRDIFVVVFGSLREGQIVHVKTRRSNECPQYDITNESGFTCGGQRCSVTSPFGGLGSREVLNKALNRALKTPVIEVKVTSAVKGCAVCRTALGISKAEGTK